MLIATEILRKKRDGAELSSEELGFLVEGFTRGTLPDYQISAFLMAAYLQGLSGKETALLTGLMKNSGESLEWRKLSQQFQNAVFADKHSTGGVGDKVSLILAPLAVCLGLKVPMMSGRGLGHTGGTVDKLQSIEGFNMYPDETLMLQCLDEVGLCMMAQSEKLCPADRKLYSLRDVTATVESIPLITASIVSKKWAEGVDVIVYDVKCGPAAFMTELARARALARSLVDASSAVGLRASALITRMDEPLGAMIGNALEVRESLSILRQDFPSPEARRLAAPLTQLCLELTAEMAFRARLFPEYPKALQAAATALENGAALKVFQAMVRAQGGTSAWEENLREAPVRSVVTTLESGFVKSIDSRGLGLLGLRIGVGRERAEQSVDAAVGFELLTGVGERVEQSQPLLRVHLRRPEQLDEILPELRQCFELSPEPVPPPPPLTLERMPPA